MSNYRVIYNNNSATIQKNKAPNGWIPLWDNVVTVHKDSDISTDIFNSLSEDDQLSIWWFFQDLQTYTSKENN